MERGLFSEVEKMLSMENIRSHVQEFAKFNRYTGTPQGERAAKYISDTVKSYGVEIRNYVYEAYTSLPLSASILCEGKTIRAIAAVYSGSIRELESVLYYDKLGESKIETWEEQEQRFRDMKGKIVLTVCGGGNFAKQAASAGALGVIQMQTSPEKQIHHTTLGDVWGTPIPADRDLFSFLPFVSVNRDDGEYLKRHCGQAIVLNTETECSVKTTTMPVAVIPGKSPSFVLISGHYDSWYEGVTDNAVSDAIMMEYARIFQKLSSKLKRGVVIGWWSGHSDARYSGSAYFCDQEWRWLKDCCVGHINLDLTGCKGAEQIRARTALTEGESFTGDLIKKYTKRERLSPIPMIRGADQSFWGVDLPIHIMLKYEVADEKRNFQCPSGGPWWHSDEDTLDKYDDKFAERDAKINAEIAAAIIDSTRIPVDLTGFLRLMKAKLKDLEKEIPETLDLEEEVYKLDELEEQLLPLCSHPMFNTQKSDHIIKTVVGGLARITYSYSSPYEQDRARGGGMFPGFSDAIGKNLKNTKEEDFLFLKNEFIRQKNRMRGEIDQILTAVRLQLLQWKELEQIERG